MNPQPIKRLQGAAARAAMNALDKNLGPAELEVERLAAELEQALIAGKETSDIRARLAVALKERDRLGDERAARREQAETRKTEKIVAAAQALIAAGNAATNSLLEQYAFAI